MSLLLDHLTETAYSSWGRTKDEDLDTIADAIDGAVAEAAAGLTPGEAATILLLTPEAFDMNPGGTTGTIGGDLIEIVRSIIAGRLHWHWCVTHGAEDERLAYVFAPETLLRFRDPGDWRIV
jgi:hypothetical protein